MPTAPSSKELRLLRPSTRCATITPRPHDYKSASGGAKGQAGGSHYQPQSPDNVPNAFLTSVGDDDYSKIEQRYTGEELLTQLKDKVKGRHSEIKQAFYAFDGDRSSYVTLSELKKIVENFIFPLTGPQFDDLVKRIDGVSGNKINYNQFLFKINNKKKRESPVLGRITPANNSLDSIVQKLQDKLQDNITKISKGMRMFDHQNNGKLRKADLKRVLENFAFHMTREQFDKMYAHYDTLRDGSIEYIPFLKKVMSTTIPIKPSGTSPTQELVIFEEAEEEQRAEKELAIPAEPLWCETVPLVEVEIKLRNKIKHRIQLLYRTFSSMDIHHDGYVTIDQLRRALEKFAFPMTDNIFSKLMERMEVKAKHKLRYETFLYKFQDRRVGGYGQALVMKPNHRYHPVIESCEESTLESIIERLKSKIVNGYSSIKQAFLVFDENKSGKVNRKDFKNVIDGFCFRMSEAQFNKLMSVVDPDNKGYVTYQHFFKMFEQTESSESHKWLNSVHKSNTAREHKQLEDAQFEELLQKKISDESKMVAIAFTNFDKEGTGTISKRQLSKFLERFSVPFSKAQFEKLVARCECNSDGTLNFYKFMEKIGVDLQVCDYGYSNKIQTDNDGAENDRQDKHRQRLEVVAQRALEHTGGLTVDNIIQQLQDYIHQRASDIRKLFIRYDEEGNGRLKRAQFRKFLVKAGFLMDNVQFKELCSRMKVGRSLTYTDFLDHFQRTATQEYKDHRVKVPVLVPGAPVQAMPCVEGLRLLHSKLHNSYANLRAAFHSMDRDSDGLVNRTDLVAMLTKLLIPMTRDDINQMWEVIGKGKKRLNVKEFVTAFEETESVDSHKWLVSVHHTNTTIAPKELQGDAVLKMFRMKALDQYFSLNKCFMALDKDGKGKLSKKKLRQALSDFSIPISNDEFLKLWKHFDDDRTGYIDHEQFVRRAAEDFNPGDNAGCSTNIVKCHDDEIQQFNNQQMYRRDELLMKQINTLKGISVDEIEKQFRDNLQENFPTVRQAFKSIDKENLGYIRKPDLRRVLFDFNFLVDDDQFDAILKRCGMEGKSRLSYKTFLAFFEGPQHKQEGIDNFDSLENRIAPYIDSYPDLDNKDAENKMKFMVSEISEVLLQAFSAMDWKESGLVNVEDLRRVLDNFCFNMTDKQFNFMIKKVPIVSDGRLDYKEFLKAFPISEDDSSIDIESLRKESKAWLEAVLGRSESAMTTDSAPPTKSRLSRRSQSCTNLVLRARPDSAPFVSAEHVESKIVSSIKQHWMELHKYYKHRSEDNNVSTEVFQAGLEAVGIVLSVMDLSILCKKYDSKGSNRIAFKEFLRKFTVSGRMSGMSGRSSVNSADSRMSSALSFSYNLSRAASCTSLDDYRSPSADTVRSVSRSLVSQMQRSNTTLGDLTPGPGIEPPAYVLEKVAPHVTAKWRELRKGFKSIDKASKRWVTTEDFRTVMRGQHIDIAETDFSDLISFYMAHSGGKVFYNDFLRAFLSVAAVG